MRVISRRRKIKSLLFQLFYIPSLISEKKKVRSNVCSVYCISFYRTLQKKWKIKKGVYDHLCWALSIQLNQSRWWTFLKKIFIYLYKINFDRLALFINLHFDWFHCALILFIIDRVLICELSRPCGTLYPCGTRGAWRISYPRRLQF